MLLMLLACAGDSVNLDDTGDSVPVGAVDQDGDGYTQDNDCDDTDDAVNPGADEVCDGVDNNCNDEVDEDPVDADTYYSDQDGDGFGGGEAILACEQPANTVENSQDCDDADPRVNPDAQEVCDPRDTDEDCDGLADDADDDVDPSTFETSWEDSDGDGYGFVGSAIESCDPVSGYVDNFGDCDDSDPSVWDECGSGSGWDGRYTGTLELKVTASDLGISDTCSGKAEIDVNESDSPAIDGTMTCSFAGVLATLLGSQTATIDGEVYSDDSADGEIDVGGLVSDAWTGGFTKAKGGTLEGGISGNTVYEGYKVSYTGTFVVTR